jgi:hypothetical protein
MLTVVGVALGLVGCGDSGGGATKRSETAPASAATVAPTPSGGDGLRAFTGCDDLVAHARALARPYVTARGFGRGFDGRQSGGAPHDSNEGNIGPPPDPGVLVRPSDGDAPSLTPGRDERSGSAATNGRLLVTARAEGLGVTDVSGPVPVARGALAVGSGGFSGPHVVVGEHRALVLGAGAESDGRAHGLGIGVIDLTDPDHPRLESAEVVTGSVQSVSIAGDVVRVAVRTDPYLVFHEPTGDNGRSSLARNRAVVEQASVADWLPSKRILDRAGRPGPAAALVACDAVRHPAVDSGLAFLSILTFDLSRRDALRSSEATAVLADTDVVYAAPDRLYVATFPGAWGRAAGDAYAPPTIERSILHEFELTHAGPARYTASGRLSGWVPDEWALSQQKDGLLVLVDNGRISESTVRRSIVLMRRQGTRLRDVRRYPDVDRVGYNLGWFGAVAVIAQGRSPAVGVLRITGPGGRAGRGTLHVPGYSDFVAAADRHHMIAVGEGPDAGGALTVSAFDIGDLTAPRRTGRLALGPGSRSDAEDDASRARYLPRHRNLVLPVWLPIGEAWRRALIAVHVAKDGTLSESGRWLARTDVKRSRDGDFVEFLNLPDGRLVVLERKGVTILSGRDLSVRGSTAYPTA